MQPNNPEQERRIPTEQEDAMARAIDERVPRIRETIGLLHALQSDMSGLVTLIAALHREIASGRYTLTSKRTDDNVAQILAARLAFLTDGLAEIKGHIDEMDVLGGAHERVALMLREYGFCPQCGGLHHPQQHMVIDLREHLGGAGPGFMDLFRRGDEPTQN